MHRFFPIRIAEKNINRATSVLVFGAFQNDGVPNLCAAIAHDSLSNIHDERFAGYAELAIDSRITVDLEFKLIVKRHGIPSLIAGNLWRDFSAQASSVWCARGMSTNPVFQQILRGSSDFELLEAPFQNHLSDIAELSLLASSKLFKLGPQSLSDPDTDLCLPFTH
jgi:hypothetical protein